MARTSPWVDDDDPNPEYWRCEKFDPAWNPTGMLEVSSFSRIYPQYREKYIQDCWPIVESALKEYVACKLNLVEGYMTVSTTKKTRDPYIIVKARDLLRLLSRSVPARQAVKILEDDMCYDIINVRNWFRTKVRFLIRRQRLLGPSSSTLKAVERSTKCYLRVKGNTVAVMGSYRRVQNVREFVEGCVKSTREHPLVRLQLLEAKWNGSLTSLLGL